MKRVTTALGAVVLAATMVISNPGTALAAETDPSWATCSEHSFTVPLSATDPTTYTIYGRLCLKSDNARGNKTVMMMISGLTYDHTYFNSTYQPSTYSWVYAATSRGYSTFIYDRLGVGASGKPPANQLTVQNHAYTAEQIVRKLRAGSIGGRAFTNVVGVGHSLGAGVLQYLAGTVTDPVGVPNYLVFSGWLHQGSLPALTTLATSLHEAGDDPAFSSAGLPSGYMTTLPNSRGANFYNTASAETAMITQDEATKQTGTIEERQTLATVRASAVTLSITVPVILSVGQKDTLQCNESAGLTCASSAAIKAREASYYGPKACLAGYMVTDAGHSVNFHIKARDSYNYVNTWLDDYTINKVSSKDANGCLSTY
ncbi:MAG: alpha/beta fold hydrolase [Micromonosporaceae bacterium]|nr:alpha/beta fold hydrolase [Micromonosporaceae bacterium]